MSVYVHSAIGRERARLELVRAQIELDPTVPDAVAAHVKAAIDALDDAANEVRKLIDRRARA